MFDNLAKIWFLVPSIIRTYVFSVDELRLVKSSRKYSCESEFQVLGDHQTTLDSETPIWFQRLKALEVSYVLSFIVIMKE